jgi:phosphoglycerol transferase MdoB-like AlkP superfamily enzyme
MDSIHTAAVARASARSTRAKENSPWKQLVADAVLWLVFLTLLMACRGFLLWNFRTQLGSSVGGEAFLRCFRTGLRFDICVATYVVLPSFVLSLIGFWRSLGRWHDRVRRWLARIVLGLWAVAFVCDTGYFAEYGDQFDSRILGLVYDDRGAIFTTIWKSYPVVTLTCASVAIAALVIWATNRLWLRAARKFEPPAVLNTKWARAAMLAAVLGLTIVGLRGSVGPRPIQMKDAATTGDNFLNRIVLNPFFALRYVVSEYLTLQGTAGLKTFLPDGDVKAAAVALFPAGVEAKNLDECLLRTAPGAKSPRPSHIFLIVMESYDSWAMEPQFASLGLTKRLTALGEQGIHVRAFLPSGGGTEETLGALITGLPESGVMVNYQGSVRRGLPTDIAGIFKRLGYKPRFFYGGYLSWQRLGDFCREHGFEEIYGGDKMSARLTGNEWGVDDKVLFQFILDHTADEPTFDLVMTTSYHPPFSVNLEAEGWDAGPLKTNALCRSLSEHTLRILGHLWYSDKCVANFMAEAEGKFGNPCFAVTGDHYSRRCIKPVPSLYESESVPLVLYGKPFLAKKEQPLPPLAGSHLDIAPTLVNLVAPEGFAYHSFGRDLFDATKRQVGFGRAAVITPDYIATVGEPMREQNLNGEPLRIDEDADHLILRHRQLHGLGWWRAVKGAAWPSTATTTTRLHNTKSLRLAFQ